MSRRKRKLANELGTFVQKYARKRKNTPDPNDRSYDRELEAKLKRMRPEELDALLREEIEEDENHA